MPNIDHFNLSEIPFTSVQGEGKTIGKLSYFLRFYGCNLKCSFCDSKFSWENKKNVIKYPLYKIEEDVIRNYNNHVRNVVITGGEPLLYQNKIIKLIRGLYEEYCELTYEIETSGGILLTDKFLDLLEDYRHNVFINLSPKLHFKDEKYVSIVRQNINSLHSMEFYDYILKFVYDKSIEKELLSYSWGDNIYVMPECKTREEHIAKFEEVLSFCKKHGFNFSPRLHILLWGNKKGV